MSWPEQGGTLEGSVFTINWENGNSAIINGFEDGRFGIRLGEEEPEAYEPVIDGNVIKGDFGLKDFYNDEGNVYHKKDSLGNWIIDEDKPDPGRSDDIQDSTANDELYGYGGIDYLHGIKGGDNILDGCSGEGWAEDGVGNSVLVGGQDTGALAA